MLKIKSELNFLSYRLRDKDSHIEYLKQIANENEIEKHDMKIIVEETLAKHINNDANMYESEKMRVELQEEY
jgi:hypothetical protein